MRVDACIEFRRVEPEIGRSLLEVGVVQLRLIREEAIVVRPEFTLLARARRRFCRGPRIGVPGQRVVTIDEMDPIAVRIQHLRDGRIRAQAERTLEIRELDDFDRRVRRPLGRAVGQ